MAVQTKATRATQLGENQETGTSVEDLAKKEGRRLRHKSDARRLRRYSKTRGNQSAIDGTKIKSATKTKSATKNGSVPM
jgi:hypothetical protein